MPYDIGSKVFGSWEIVREIGHGAYGHVYEIRKTEYGVTATSALKLIRIPTSEKEVKEALSEGMDYESVSSYFRGFVDDLVAEISVMAKFSGHPNIVGYQDHHVEEHKGEIGWDILIRMELLESLINYMLRKKDLSEKQIIRLGRDIANALVTCEEQGIVHRDVKPDNIFVDPTGNFKLGDFGVARAIEKTTGGLSKKGTESYMAPEVYFGKPYGKSVDIYSLGLVLYRLANKNRMPFYPLDTKMVSYTDREEALSKRMKGSPIPVPCDASPELAEIILKACAYDPKDRWQSAADLKAALEDLMRGNSKKEKEESLQSVTSEETAGVSNNQSEETVGIHDNQSSDETVGIRDNQSEETIGIHDERSEETVGIREEQYEETVGIYSKPKKEKADPARKNDGQAETPSYISQTGSKDEPYDFTPETDTKKKKSTLIAVLAALAVVAGIVIYALIPKAKDVVISSGSGSGKYKKGDTVSIKAESKEGYDFAEWTIQKGNVTLEDSKAEETTFIMGKEPVELEASYELKTYTLTVEDGTIQGADGKKSGNYHEGDRIVAEPDEKEGYTFTGWKTSDSGIITQDSGDNLIFEMPDEEFTVTAEYAEAEYPLEVKDGSINGKENTGSFKKGTRVTIKADKREGYDFSEWIVKNGNVILDDPKAEETTFEMVGEAVDLEAAYEVKTYFLTVNDGTIQGTEGEKTGRYHEGDQIVAKPDEKEGYTFSGWEISDSGVITQESGNNLMFEMPDKDITLSAEYEEAYSITINNGSIVYENGETAFRPGTVINIAAEVDEGSSFVSWNVDQGSISLEDPSAEETSFVMGHEDVVISAETITYPKLKRGGDIQELLKQLSGSFEDIFSEDEIIEAIVFSDSPAPSGVRTESLSETGNTVIAWFDDNSKTINIYTPADKILLNESCDCMFHTMKKLKNIDLSRFDSSLVTDMGAMFQSCESLTGLDLSGFDTSSVTDMGSMFNGCESLTELDLSGFDTSSVTDMGSMFMRCSALKSIDLSSFDTSSVTHMFGMFNDCSSLTELDLRNFDTSSVMDEYGMALMFSGCSNLKKLNLSSFDTSSVPDMGSMFYGCSSLWDLNLSSFDTSSVTDMSSMFSQCSNLRELHLSNFDTSSVTDMNGMFRGCNSLSNLDISSFRTSSVKDMSHMFSDCSSLNELDLSSFNTSSVENMFGMFDGCSELVTLNLSGFDTSLVDTSQVISDMGNMFSYCNNLTNLIAQNQEILEEYNTRIVG